MIQNDKSGTLSCNNDQTLFVINGQGGADYLITENVTDALTAATNSSGNNKLVVVLNDQGGAVMSIEKADVAPTLRSESHQHEPIICMATQQGGQR